MEYLNAIIISSSKSLFVIHDVHVFHLILQNVLNHNMIDIFLNLLAR